MTSTPSGAGTTDSTRHYRRDLGLWFIVMLTVGAIFGSAVPFVPVTVLALAGPAGLVAWVLGFILVIPIAFGYAELGTMWPRAGGVAYYPSKSHGPVTGVINAWSGFVGYCLVMPGVAAATFEYASYFYPPLFHNGTLTTLGLAASILATLGVLAINSRRIKILGEANAVFTITKVALVLVLLGALLYFFKPTQLTNSGGFSPLGITGIFLATSATIFAYAGFRQPIDFAEEVKNPGRTIPLAITISLIFVFLLYFALSLAFLGVLNFAQLGLTAGNWSGLTSLPYPLTSASDALGLTAVGLIAIVIAALASYSDAIIYHGSAARVANTAARYDRFFPQVFSRLSREGIPFNAVVLVFVIAVVYLILLPSFTAVLGVLVDAIVISYAPGMVSLLVFRRKYPDHDRPFKLPAAVILAPAAFVIGGFLVFWSGYSAVLVAAPTALVGLVLLPIFHRNRRLRMADLRGGLWFPIYIVFIFLLSYVSSSYFGGTGLLPFPYDNIVFLIGSIAFFIVGYYSGTNYNEVGVFDDSESASNLRASDLPEPHPGSPG
jgi:amino acid transporter